MSNVNINFLLRFHKQNEKLVTVTAVQPDGRFGSLTISAENNISSFVEKPPGDNFWINGGFFVLEQGAIDFIEGDESIWERIPLEEISKRKQLVAFKHDGFCQPMDTLRDKNYLNNLWKTGQAPWRLWNE